MTLLFQSPSFDLSEEMQPGVFRLESPGRSLVGVAGVEIRHGQRNYLITTDALRLGRVEQRMVEDAHGKSEEIALYYQQLHDIALSVRFRLYPHRPFMLLRLTATHTGGEPVALQRFLFRTVPGGFKPLEPPTGCYVNGWASWSPARFLPATGRDPRPLLPLQWLAGPSSHNAGTPWGGQLGRFWSETVGAVVTAREALVVGGASLADQFVQTWVDLRPGHLALWLQSQADGIPLSAGEAVSSEWFYLEWVALPNQDPLAQYAHAVARQMAVPPLRSVPVGWCSWYIFWAQISEAQMMENLATAAVLADELPLQLLQLDQGYEPAWGDWLERNARFPHTLDWLAQRISGSSLTPGLWLGPLTVHKNSRLAREHPDWLLHDRRGRLVSAGLVGPALGRALDPTHPGVEEHLRQLIDTAVNRWGYSFLKLDFLYAGALPGRRNNPRMTRAQAYRHALRIIREAAGEETFLLGCGAPLGPSVGLVDGMRIGPDTAPTWEPNNYGLRRILRTDPGLPSLRNSLRNGATRAWIHKHWWLNDPDALMVRDSQTSLTADEVITQATLIGLSGGLLILSDDLARLSLERRQIAAALLPPLQEEGGALDLFRRSLPEELHVPMVRPWERWQLIGLFNWEDQPVERGLPRDLPGMDAKRAYHIVDFWHRRYLRREIGMPYPTFTLPPHGAVLLGLRPVRPTPQLVGTTFHISQGGEVTAWECSAQAVTLSLDLNRTAAGEVWLALPRSPTATIWEGQPLLPEAVRAVAPGVWAVACQVIRHGTLRVEWAAEPK